MGSQIGMYEDSGNAGRFCMHAYAGATWTLGTHVAPLEKVVFKHEARCRIHVQNLCSKQAYILHIYAVCMYAHVQYYLGRTSISMLFPH